MAQQQQQQQTRISRKDEWRAHGKSWTRETTLPLDARDQDVLRAKRRNSST